MILDIMKNNYYIACIIVQTARLQREQLAYSMLTACGKNYTDHA